MLLWVYTLKKRFRALLKMIFRGDTPEWAKDLGSPVRAMNVLALIPTLIAIYWHPRHFFNRLDLLLSKRKSGIKDTVYKSPVSFALKVAALMLAVKWFVKYLPAEREKLILAGVFVTLPIIIPALCLVFYPLFWVLSLMLISNPVSAFLVRIFPAQARAVMVERLKQRRQQLLVPISPSTYRNLNWPKMGWSLLYLYGYFISFPLLLLVALGWSLSPAVKSAIRDPFAVLSGFVGAAWVVGAIGLVVYSSLVRIVIYPYTGALLSALKKPTKLSRLIEMQDYRLAEVRLFAALERYETLYRPERPRTHDTKRLCASLSRFHAQWCRFVPHARALRIRFHIPNEEMVEECAALVESCYLKALGLLIVDMPLQGDQLKHIMKINIPLIRYEKKYRKKKWFRQPPPPVASWVEIAPVAESTIETNIAS